MIPAKLTIKQRWFKYHRLAYRAFVRIIGKSKDSTSKNLFRLFQFAVYAILTVFIINLLPIFMEKTSSFGAYGDFFGGVLNPILTFLTFMGLLITIILQQKELREARDEFKGQREALEDQQIEMVKQTFDNKFFQMLNSFNSLGNELVLTKGYKEPVNDKQKIFEKLYQSYLGNVYSNKNGIDNKDVEKALENLLEVYINYNEYHDSTLKYYFINLYQVLDYIDREIPNTSNSKKYTNILRARLSKYELLLLLYNGIGVIPFSGTKYKNLLDKYSFFEHLKYSDLFYDSTNSQTYGYYNFTICLILSNYNTNAFGKNIKLLEQISEEMSKNKIPNKNLLKANI